MQPVPRPPVGVVKIKKVATGNVPPLPKPPAKKSATALPPIPAPPVSTEAHHYMHSAEVDSAEIMATTFAGDGNARYQDENAADSYDDLSGNDAMATPIVVDVARGEDGDDDTQELALRDSEAPMDEARIAIQEYLPEGELMRFVVCVVFVWGEFVCLPNADPARCLPLQAGERLTVHTVEDDWAYGMCVAFTLYVLRSALTITQARIRMTARATSRYHSPCRFNEAYVPLAMARA